MLSLLRCLLALAALAGCLYKGEAQILRSLEQKIVSEGERVTFRCYAECHNSPISWKIGSPSGRIGVYTSLFSSSDVDAEYEYAYHCNNSRNNMDVAEGRSNQTSTLTFTATRQMDRMPLECFASCASDDAGQCSCAEVYSSGFVLLYVKEPVATVPTVSTEEKTASVHTSITTPTAGAGVDELEHTQPVDVTEEGISSTSSSSRDRRGGVDTKSSDKQSNDEVGRNSLVVYVMLPLGVLIGLVLGVTITAISILLVYADNKGNKIMGQVESKQH